jgi:NAD(P)-dependent dehydrogenase (short-subunit alcohol dehydrogenase family)
VYLIRTSAIELGPRGIRVNGVSPGGIRGTGMSDPDILMEKVSVLGRMGRFDEVVPAFRFLAADESSFVTGTTIVVDGGATAGLSLNLLDLIPLPDRDLE